MHSDPHSATGLQAAIIDLDGTLVDTLEDFVAALGATLASFGLPPVDRTFVARTVGKGSEHLLRGTLAEVGADAGLFDMAMERYQQHYRVINGRHAHVYPGVAEGLALLSSHGLSLACLTNKPTVFARELLRAKDLARHFSHVFGGDAFARRKPDPLPLLETCAALGCEPRRTLMIGDSRNDAQAARAAGCPVVLVTYGYNHGQPVREVDADAFVDRIDEIDVERMASISSMRHGIGRS
ncbi:MAG: phosphoglycolate phosphatase [Burkholderiales bacterium]